MTNSSGSNPKRLPNPDLQNIEAELEAFAQKWANLREAEQYELAAKATAKTAHSIQQLCSSRELAELEWAKSQFTGLPKSHVGKGWYTRNTAFKNYAVKFWNNRTQIIREKFEARAAALKKKEK